MQILQTLLQDIPEDLLSPAWTTFDLAAFSPGKALWDYQQEALQHALKALWKYYVACGAKKQAFFDWYLENGIELERELNLGKKRENVDLVGGYYPVGPGGSVDYAQLINRMGFWMATGSGKTLVIVKLLELLWQLIQRGEIPPLDVMALTHRQDLLQQLFDQVNDFNAAGKIPHIRLRELREYPQVKRELRSLFSQQEMTVFYYRSDNLSDEQKERIIDFRNYDNNGKWYVLLDEAHKGDKEDSKRQHI